MENKFAKIISFIFHPIFHPVYCLLLLFNLKSHITVEIVLHARLILLALVAITTIVFPLIIIYMMKRQGFIQSYQMESRQERRYPYLIIVIFYILTYNMFRQFNLPGIYTAYMMGASLLLIMVVVINIWWKISIHTVGIGGVFGLVTGLTLYHEAGFMFMMMIVALLAGIIGYARLKLDSHKPYEIYTGFLLGTVVMIIGTLYFVLP